MTFFSAKTFASLRGMQKLAGARAFAQREKKLINGWQAGGSVRRVIHPIIFSKVASSLQTKWGKIASISKTESDKLIQVIKWR
jgi:hypothetical protein